MEKAACLAAFLVAECGIIEVQNLVKECGNDGISGVI